MRRMIPDATIEHFTLFVYAGSKSSATKYFGPMALKWVESSFRPANVATIIIRYRADHQCIPESQINIKQKPYLRLRMPLLDILFHDDELVAINKPHGLLVHRSSIAADAEEFALQILRDQLNRHVFPAHRLDRKTGGVLLFALSKDAEKMMQQQFQENLVDKKYLAIVRGHTPDYEEIDYPLRKENGILQEAFTRYRTLARAEVDVALGSHPTSRYSLVEANPQTGRMHQLRKHFAHIFHPIIGDRTHGCNKQNKLFKEKWEMDTMLLHASEVSFTHPVTKLLVHIKAPLQDEFLRMMKVMGW